jgi:hypothetical protein
MILFGKIRIPAVQDTEGEGYIFVRFVLRLKSSRMDDGYSCGIAGFMNIQRTV